MSVVADLTQSIDGEKLAEGRNKYYDKWDKFTKTEVEKTKEELEKEKEEADKALGIDPTAPKSEAEKQDKDKIQALKEAKKQWDQKNLGEAAMKFAVENLDKVERVLDSVKLKWKPVIILKNNKNSKLKLPHDLKHKLIKVFIENCTDCEFDFEVPLITQHVEIAHCKNCVIRVKDSLATLQLDLCDNIRVEYAENLLIEKKVKLFHAGVSNLTIESDDGHSHRHSYVDHITDEKLPKEIQFLTQLVAGKVITEKVVRDKGNLPSTQSELDEQELPRKTYLRDAELKKIGGNEAFSEKNYAQAAIFYTESIDLAEKASDSGQTCDFVHVLYGNRAFCWQKLGHHEKAEADGKKAIEIEPTYVKGLFRLGLALHAQKKYFEAAPILSKALELEPKNEQIKQAIGFADIQMRKMLQQKD